MCYASSTVLSSATAKSVAELGCLRRSRSRRPPRNTFSDPWTEVCRSGCPRSTSVDGTNYSRPDTAVDRPPVRLAVLPTRPTIGYLSPAARRDHARVVRYDTFRAGYRRSWAASDARLPADAAFGAPHNIALLAIVGEASAEGFGTGSTSYARCARGACVRSGEELEFLQAFRVVGFHPAGLRDPPMPRDSAISRWRRTTSSSVPPADNLWPSASLPMI